MKQDSELSILVQQGNVKVFGKARRGLLNDDPEAAAALKVGMVFQNGALFDSLTVGENVGFLLYEHSQLNHERIRVCQMSQLYCSELSSSAQHLFAEAAHA